MNNHLTEAMLRFMKVVLLLASISFRTVTGTDEIRLENGTNACSGRVEVFYNGSWGTVCDNQWDLKDAAVVCKQLGCGNVIEAKSGAYFGQGSGQIWMDNIQCAGSESTLQNCSSIRWGENNCSHQQDAGVRCQSVRLIFGDNSCSGRVEVFYNGSWGTVCDNHWDLTDAAVVCREMGCGDVIEAKSKAYFGQGSGQIWMDDVNCTGNESSLMNCTTPGWGKHNCVHGQDAGVICEVNVRLVNGDNNCSGRVEVFRDSQWKTVCDDGWDLSEAKVVCQELGCAGAVASSHAYFGQGSAPMWMKKAQCNGVESTLKKCRSDVITSCPNQTTAGVICDPPVKLFNGNNSCSGNVQIRYNGVWGTVCDDGWDLTDAKVVCRQIGCGEAIETKTAAYFGQGSERVWMNNVSCSGSESAILDCSSNGRGQQNCSHEKGAGVICAPNVRLQNGSSNCSGRVEVFYNGSWGRVCDDGWDLTDAAVVCGEIGCGNAVEHTGVAFFGNGSGPIWMNNVNCNGNEPTIKRCRSSGWDVGISNGCKDAGVVCQYDHVYSTTVTWNSTTEVTSTTSSSPRNSTSVYYNLSSNYATSSSTTEVKSTSATASSPENSPLDSNDNLSSATATSSPTTEATSTTSSSPRNSASYYDNISSTYATSSETTEVKSTSVMVISSENSPSDSNDNLSSTSITSSSTTEVTSSASVYYDNLSSTYATSSSSTVVKSTSATASSPENTPSDSNENLSSTSVASSATTEVTSTTATASSPRNSASVYSSRATTEATSTTAASSSPRNSTSVYYDSLSSTTAILSSTTEVTSTTNTASSQRNSDSVYYTFTYINESKSWIDALGYCKVHHQTLAHILNATAQEHITQMLQGKEITDGVWIGLERDMCFTCSPWEWTGGPKVDYNAWSRSFPVEPRSRFCGKLLKEKEFGWVDECCFELLPFICQG